MGIPSEDLGQRELETDRWEQLRLNENSTGPREMETGCYNRQYRKEESPYDTVILDMNLCSFDYVLIIWAQLQGSGVAFVGTKALSLDWQVSVRAKCYFG